MFVSFRIFHSRQHPNSKLYMDSPQKYSKHFLFYVLTLFMWWFNVKRSWTIFLSLFKFPLNKMDDDSEEKKSHLKILFWCSCIDYNAIHRNLLYTFRSKEKMVLIQLNREKLSHKTSTEFYYTNCQTIF